MSNPNKPTNKYTTKPPTPVTATPEPTTDPVQEPQAESQNPQPETPNLPETTATSEIPEAEQPNQVASSTETPADTQPVAETPASVVTDPAASLRPLEQPKEVVIDVPSSNRSKAPAIHAPLNLRPAPDATAQQLVDAATKANNLSTMTLADELNDFKKKFSRETVSDELQATKNMQALYKMLLRVINTDKTAEEFASQWGLIIQTFAENKSTKQGSDGFAPHRLYRGVAGWALGHEEYRCFQTLCNLIDASHRYDSSKRRKIVDLVKVASPSITEAGRGRLLSYYI